MSALIELAVRVEKLAGSDREVDAEIALACGWSRFLVKDTVIGDELCWKTPSGDITPCTRSFTASLDAAMTLMPEGWQLTHAGFVQDDEYASGWQCELVSWPDRYVSVGVNDAMDWHRSDPRHVATLPLAITAAALRAHAAPPSNGAA